MGDFDNKMTAIKERAKERLAVFSQDLDSSKGPMQMLDELEAKIVNYMKSCEQEQQDLRELLVELYKEKFYSLDDR